MVICPPPLYGIILDEVRELGKETRKEGRRVRQSESFKQNITKRICRTK